MNIVTATKIDKNTRIPPRAEGMTMAVIGTPSGAGIDGETGKWENGEAHT